MSYTIIKNYVDKSKYDIKCPYLLEPTSITVHNTDNDAPAENEVAYMRRNNLQISFHVAIDDKHVVYGIPLNRNAWHAGDGGKGKGNRTSIAVEICYSASGGKKFDAAEKNAAKWIASELHRRNWDISRVKRHKDWSGKNCPARTMKLGWKRFLNMIEAELEKYDKDEKPSKPSKPIVKPPTISNGYYKAFSDNSIVDGLNSIGVNSSFENRKKIAKANGISNYEGTASQNEKLLALAKKGKLKKVGSATVSNPTNKPVKTSAYYKKCSANKLSLVDGLKEIGVNSSFEHRKKIAKANGMKTYGGTAKENVKLLTLLKNGKLKKA